MRLTCRIQSWWGAAWLRLWAYLLIFLKKFSLFFVSWLLWLRSFFYLNHSNNSPRISNTTQSLESPFFSPIFQVYHTLKQWALPLNTELSFSWNSRSKTHSLPLFYSWSSFLFLGICTLRISNLWPQMYGFRNSLCCHKKWSAKSIYTSIESKLLSNH